MAVMFYVRAKCHGCGHESEHVVTRETYSAKCPNPKCPQHVSLSPVTMGLLVPDKCSACGKPFDDHRWVGNVANCKEKP